MTLPGGEKPAQGGTSKGQHIIMVITHLKLESFRSFVGTDLEMGAPRVFVTGLNGAGKTTLKEAIRYALTGRAIGVDGKGSGQQKLVPDGQQHVSVTADVGGLGAIQRSFDTGGSTLKVEGFSGDTKAQQAALYDKLQITEPFLQACLESRVFLDLEHAAAKDLVLNLLNVRVKLGDDETVYTLAELDALYDKAFEDRKLVKRQLAAFQMPVKPADESHAKVEDLDRTLVERRSALDALLTTTGETRGTRDALTSRRARLVGMADHELPPALRDAQDALADAEATAAATAAAPVVEDVPEAGDPARLPFLLSQIAALEAHKPKNGCVLCGDVPCETPAAKFTKVIKIVKTEAEALTEALPLDAAPTVDPKAEAQAKVDRCRQVVRACEDAITRETQRVADLADLDRQLAELPDLTAQDKQIADLRARIARGTEIRTAAAAYWSAAEAHKIAVEKATTLRASVDELEKLCDVLGPSGVRVQALGTAIAGFEQAINTFTAPYGLTVAFALDPWGVTVNKRSASTYSKSEQHRIGIAIQLAVAMLSGLKFAIVDELDMLDEANRNAMAKLLIQSPLDQILILGTRETSQPLPTVPQMPGVMLAYRLVNEQGRSRVVERAAV